MLRNFAKRLPVLSSRTSFSRVAARSFATSPAIQYQGIQTSEIVHEMKFRETFDGIPILRYLNFDGTLVDGVELPFSIEKAQEMMELMLVLSVYDKMFYEVQRQGRVSFYMTSTGEEALMVGTGSALDKKDVLFTQYRELGVLMARGFSLDNILDQVFATANDPGKGRQMPIHYTSKEINLQTVSSPLCTQVPQAAGAGYVYKVRGEKQAAICYFGEGAASEGDFAAGLNFASTLGSQTVFICRNNGLAISTPVQDQYRGDGIAVRGVAYGMPVIRVDGNDLIASYAATKAAREMCIRDQRPVLVELMSYRLGHHSTSDDASRYRNEEEAKMWMEDGITAITRFRRFLESQGAWTAERENEIITKARKDVLKGIKDAETNRKSAPIESIFTDVYAPRANAGAHQAAKYGDLRLDEQADELRDHLKLHMDKYKELERYQSSSEFDVQQLLNEAKNHK